MSENMIEEALEQNVLASEEHAFREWCREMLNEPAEQVRVKFTKADGTVREMVCTTSPFQIPEDKQPKGTRDTFTEDVQRVFDVEKQEWRSFRWDSVESFTF